MRISSTLLLYLTNFCRRHASISNAQHELIIYNSLYICPFVVISSRPPSCVCQKYEIFSSNGQLCVLKNLQKSFKLYQIERKLIINLDLIVGGKIIKTDEGETISSLRINRRRQHIQSIEHPLKAERNLSAFFIQIAKLH